MRKSNTTTCHLKHFQPKLISDNCSPQGHDSSAQAKQHAASLHEKLSLRRSAEVTTLSTLYFSFTFFLIQEAPFVVSVAINKSKQSIH